MLCDVVVRRRWAHAPVIHAASHFDHKKRVAWVPIFMHICAEFCFYNYGAPLGSPSGRRSSAKISRNSSNLRHGSPLNMTYFCFKEKFLLDHSEICRI